MVLSFNTEASVTRVGGFTKDVTSASTLKSSVGLFAKLEYPWSNGGILSVFLVIKDGSIPALGWYKSIALNLF